MAETWEEFYAPDCTACDGVGMVSMGLGCDCPPDYACPGPSETCKACGGKGKVLPSTPPPETKP